MSVYFVSYTHTSNSGNSFGFGNMYISATDDLTMNDAMEFRETIEKETGKTNVVVMFFKRLTDTQEAKK